MGDYRLCFHQLIQGIPVIESGAGLGCAHPQSRALATSWVNIASPNNFTLVYSSIKEKDIIVEDIPLLPFTQIKATFEDYIAKGVVRDIYRVEFGYMLFDDEQNQGYVLKPIWAMYCDIMSNPKKPALVRSPAMLFETKLTGPIGVFVDAQTGEAYTQFEVPKSRKSLPAGKIIYWNDVK
jgi:hypothetical protein